MDRHSLEEVWATKADAELVSAAAHLRDYEDEAREVIRAELARREIDDLTRLRRVRWKIHARPRRHPGPAVIPKNEGSAFDLLYARGVGKKEPCRRSFARSGPTS